MEAIRFTDTTLISLGIEAALMILIPIFLVLKFKVKIKPLITGACTFFLFAVILKLPLAYLLFFADNPAANAINHHDWLYYLVAGLLAGIFEETGRFTAYKTVLRKNTDPFTSLSYGIGHGGFESIYISLSIISIIITGIMINNGNLSQITNGMGGQQLETMLAQLQEYANSGPFEAFLGVLERISAIALHIGLSIIVFKAAHDKHSFFLYPVAIGIHFFADFSILFFKLGLPMFLFELLFLVISIVVLVPAYQKIYRKYSEPLSLAEL